MPVLKSLRPFASSFRNTARQLLALALVFASVFAIGPAAPLFAEAAAAPYAAQSVTPSVAPMMLHITILDGEDSLNDIRERTAREPIVQVEDENHKPVAGALILFSLQNGGSGAGGTFNGLSSLSVTTDAQGRAVAHGLKPNQTAGSYSITVTATLGALVATAIIHQSNVVGAGGGGAPPAAPAEPAVPPASVAPAAPATTEAAATPAGGGFSPPLKIHRGLRHIPKKVWITGATIVVTGVVVGVVVANSGSNSTTITPGTGTVGP